VRKILAYIGEQDISIVNSFDLKTLLVALAAKVRFGRRLRLVHHLISLWDGLRDHHKTLLWNALRYPDVIICNGHAVKTGLIGSRRMRTEVLVIPNGVDCRHFAPDAELRRAEREKLGIAPNEFVLGTVANIRPVKNFPFLLRGMRRLADRYPEARLVCVGGGPQLEEMRALAHSLGVGDAVLFAGQTQDVRPWLATFDAFALCSFKEGCPNALMQAMAMEVASISSDVGEVSHLTDGGTCGLLFHPTDGDTFVRHAARLMEDELYRVRLAQAGRRRMEEHYDGAKMIDAYVTMFAALAGRTDTRSAA
ncbi:MAG: glycosyltransferase family 4 protein, partial [Gemmatimonadaceae bacterium]